MKSLVQEATTIQKAIENAWHKANKPATFHVKVLEEPERNFLGMVTRSAKIAITFEQKTQQETEKYDEGVKKAQSKQQTSQRKHVDKKQPEKHKQHAKQEDSRKTKQQTDHTHTSQKQEKSGQKAEKKEQQKAEQKSKQQGKPGKEKPQSQWTSEKVKHAQQWLQNVLAKMGYENISFTIEPQNLYLRIELSDRLLTQKDKEKQLLASLSSLMMATMQRHYKGSFRGHKIVLTHP